MTYHLEILTAAYTEHHRRYHTLEHIAHMFNAARDHDIKLSPAQIQAIWWHDVVYIPGSKTNEEDSVALMRKHCAIDSATEKASQIIMDTKNHVPSSAESAVVCDLDMFGFVENIQKHSSINAQIEEEFMLGGISLDEYREGRTKFLNELLSKPVFHSDIFVKYNELAHKRIAIDISHVI